jgi:hypothetical protein
LVLGVAAWLLVVGFTWPLGFSFSDDIGYVGEAKILLAGRVLPRAEDAGIWTSTEIGLVAKYPLFPSLLMAPLLAITPRAVFALGIASAIAACLIGASVLRSWGTAAGWALLILAHPTVVIISRTATADVPLTALALAAWWALRQNRRGPAIVLCAAMFAIKATGFLIGLLLLGGETLRTLLELRRTDAEARRRLVTSLMGIAAGFVLIFAMNLISARRLGFAYDHQFLGTPPFWFTYFKTAAPAQLQTLLLFPPLLILGVLPYWRRRELGPVCLILGFSALMCFYFFVDSGTTWVESLVLAPRLLLPVVVFLLIGYADLISSGLRRVLGHDARAGTVLICGTAAIVAAVSVEHSRWQAPMAEARRAAERIVAHLGANELGLAPQAVKAGLLFDGPTPVVSMSDTSLPVVLCNERSASHRAPDDGTNSSCEAPAYRSDYRVGGFHVLVRLDRWTQKEK